MDEKNRAEEYRTERSKYEVKWNNYSTELAPVMSNEGHHTGMHVW